MRKEPCSPGHRDFQSLSSEEMVSLLQGCLQGEMRSLLNEFPEGQKG